MRIAVTLRVVQASGYTEPRDALSQDWARFLDQLGVTPVLVPNSLKNPVALIRELQAQALLLTNGEDVGSTPERDRLERELLEHAVSAKLPVLGVCRGMQFLNAYFGGTLMNAPDHVRPEGHPVQIRAEKLKMPGSPPEFEMNSYHKQGLNEAGLADDLKAFAVGTDGIVEGLYHVSLPILGIQWHPERPNPGNEYDRWLIRKFVDAARSGSREAFA